HAVPREELGHAGALEDVDPVVLGGPGRELAQDPAAGGAAAGVDDPAPGVAALQAERELAVAVGDGVDAEAPQVRHAVRRLAADDLGGAAADELAAGGDRVL